MKEDRIKAYLAGLGFATLFGFSFMFVKDALAGIDPFRLVAFRFALAALLMQLLVLAGVLKVSLKGKNIAPLLLIAFFEPIAYFIFETTGISLLPSSQAGMMIAVIPVFVAILAAIVLHERPNLRQGIFIALSVAGVIFIGVWQSTAESGGNMLGMLLILGAVVCAAFFTITSRYNSTRFTPAEITYVMMWVAAVVFNILALVVHGGKGDFSGYFAPLADWKVVGAILYLAAGCSVIAYFLVNYSLVHLSASESAVFSNLVTAISIVAGVVFRHEPFYWYHVIGSAMILLGVWGTNYFSTQQKTQEITVPDEGAEICKSDY